MTDAPPRIPPIVDVAWVRDHRGEVVLADVRWHTGTGSDRAGYRTGHLPGAVFVDLERDLSRHGDATEGRHPLPEPEHFAEAMSRLGIGDDDTVVAYDDSAGAFAARLVWMLRVTGHEAALLDGGLAAWDGDRQTGDAERLPRPFTATPWPADAIADIDEVTDLAREDRADAVLVDARAAERYRGEHEPIDPRAGHVPGAVNLPYVGNLRDGRFASQEELRARYRDLEGTTPIVYCGSGVTACHDILAMERAGIRARLFPGSWSAWSSDPDRPAAIGEAPR